MDPRVAYFVDPSPEADLISFSSAHDPTHEGPDLPTNRGLPAAGAGLCPNEGCLNSEYEYMYGAAAEDATECASCRRFALRRRAAAHHRWRRRANLIPPECLSIDNSRTHYINRDMNLFIEHFMPKSVALTTAMWRGAAAPTLSAALSELLEVLAQRSGCRRRIGRMLKLWQTLIRYRQHRQHPKRTNPPDTTRA